MFLRYTEKARRSIFFARYEASQLGSHVIEAEHLLLGILREMPAELYRFLASETSIETIRKKIEIHANTRERVSASEDLPLSEETKRGLAFGAEEAEMLNQPRIGLEHLLLGLLREESCFAAQLLRERGADPKRIRMALSEGADRSPGGDFGDYT
jgi:ATP-dependent Clp protease ATP-binding subunit ClpC